jgi:RNA polymerase sigma factor (sigma-70 family)
MVAEYLHLVRPIAVRILADLPPSFELDDLIQTGRIGLMNAALRYSPESFNKTPFAPYASRVIAGTIRMSTRRRHYREATHFSLDSLMVEAESPAYTNLTEKLRNHPGFTGSLEPRAENEIESVIDRKHLVKRISRAQFTDLQAAVLTDYYSSSEPSLATVAAYLGIPVWKAQRARVEAVAILREILGLETAA